MRPQTEVTDLNRSISPRLNAMNIQDNFMDKSDGFGINKMNYTSNRFNKGSL